MSNSSESNLLQNIANFIKNAGDPGRCKGCDAPIWWFTHRNGRKTPYDADLTNHFISCSHAKEFKKGNRTDGGNA